MPKQANTTWKEYLACDPCFLVTCYRITRLDGEIFCLTTHVKDLEISDSVFDAYDFGLGSTTRTYYGVALSPSESSENASVRANNQEINVAMDEDFISEADLDAGKYQYADVIVFTMNPLDLSMGAFDPWRGQTGAHTKGSVAARIVLNTLSSRAEQTIGFVTRENCRFRFGSPQCGKDLSGNNPDGVPYTSAGVAVTSLGTNTSLIFSCSSLVGKPDNFYKRGKVIWTAGPNAGLQMDIATFDSSTGEMMLRMEMPFEISAGDEGTFVAGCEKTHRACWEDHANGIRFGGFPKAPTSESAGALQRS
jgi:uncharacterized phage protein (TIGR02218 family)